MVTERQVHRQKYNTIKKSRNTMAFIYFRNLKLVAFITIWCPQKMILANQSMLKSGVMVVEEAAKHHGTARRSFYLISKLRKGKCFKHIWIQDFWFNGCTSSSHSIIGIYSGLCPTFMTEMLLCIWPTPFTAFSSNSTFTNHSRNVIHFSLVCTDCHSMYEMVTSISI